MPATLFTNTAATNTKFGLTAETGLIVKGFSVQFAPKKTELTDNNGIVCAVGYIEQPAKVKLDGVVNGATTGSLAVASTYTLANTATGYGFPTSGTVLVDSISITAGEGEFQKISAEITVYSATLAADTTF